MKQSKLKQIRLNDKLIIKSFNGVEVVKVLQIIANYPGHTPTDKLHTAYVDAISIESYKHGLATVEVSAAGWIPYRSILQSAYQPSLLTFLFDKLKRNLKTIFVLYI